MNRRLLVSLVLFLATTFVSYGQQVSTDSKAQSAPALRPAQIDRNGALTLIRSAVIALQQANETNNYGVLYAMSAPGFQSRTPVNKLAENFATLRGSKLDLSAVTVLEPQFTFVPQVDANGVMRMAGYFPSAPMQVNFDLQFTPIENRWRLLGITVTVSSAAPVAPSTVTGTSVTPTPKPSATAKAKGAKSR